LELQVIENVQRVDVHPLDEAHGYSALIELQPETYTVESIAPLFKNQVNIEQRCSNGSLL